MNSDEFLDYIKPQLKEKGVKLIIKKTSNFGGWFCSTKKELVLSADCSLFFQTAVHEYCHFIQWTQHPEIWKSADKPGDRFFSWLSGNDRIKKIDDAVLKIVTLERHCESLALSLIDELNLDINKSLYLTAANIYLFSYYFTRKYRRWAKEVYYEDLYELMPAKLLKPEQYLDIDNLAPNARKQFEKLYTKT